MPGNIFLCVFLTLGAVLTGESGPQDTQHEGALPRPGALAARAWSVAAVAERRGCREGARVGVGGDSGIDCEGLEEMKR